MLLVYLLTLPVLGHALTRTQQQDFNATTPAVCNCAACPEVSIRESTGNGPSSLHLRSNGIPDHYVEQCNGQPVNQIRYNERIPNIPINHRPRAPQDSHCVSSIVGFAKNGIPIYNGHRVYYQTGQNIRDAVEEIDIEGVTKRWTFDSCGGHNSVTGAYHYHLEPKCWPNFFVTENLFIGVALDGFPIYGPLIPDSSSPLPRVVTNADLDECHGNDFGDGYGYRYIMNAEFPYSVGCFKGDINTQPCGARQMRNTLCRCQGDAYGSGYGGATYGGGGTYGGNDCDNTSSEDNDENVRENGPPPPPQGGFQPGQNNQQQPPPQGGFQPGQNNQQQPPPQGGFQQGQNNQQQPPPQGGFQPGQNNQQQPPPQGGFQPGQNNQQQPPPQGGFQPGQNNQQQPPPERFQQSGQNNNMQPPQRRFRPGAFGEAIRRVRRQAQMDEMREFRRGRDDSRRGRDDRRRPPPPQQPIIESYTPMNLIADEIMCVETNTCDWIMTECRRSADRKRRRNDTSSEDENSENDESNPDVDINTNEQQPDIDVVPVVDPIQIRSLQGHYMQELQRVEASCELGKWYVATCNGYCRQHGADQTYCQNIEKLINTFAEDIQKLYEDIRRECSERPQFCSANIVDGIDRIMESSCLPERQQC